MFFWIINKVFSWDLSNVTVRRDFDGEEWTSFSVEGVHNNSIALILDSREAIPRSLHSLLKEYVVHGC